MILFVPGTWVADKHEQHAFVDTREKQGLVSILEQKLVDKLGPNLIGRLV